MSPAKIFLLLMAFAAIEFLLGIGMMVVASNVAIGASLIAIGGSLVAVAFSVRKKQVNG